VRHWEGYADRASQFTPYAALKGFEELIAETSRLGCEQRCLGEDAAAELDACLHALSKGRPVEAVFYDMGDYRVCSGILERIDTAEQCLWIGKQRLPLSKLLRIRELPP